MTLSETEVVWSKKAKTWSNLTSKFESAQKDFFITYGQNPKTDLWYDGVIQRNCSSFKKRIRKFSSKEAVEKRNIRLISSFNKIFDSIQKYKPYVGDWKSWFWADISSVDNWRLQCRDKCRDKCSEGYGTNGRWIAKSKWRKNVNRRIRKWNE